MRNIRSKYKEIIIIALIINFFNFISSSEKEKIIPSQTFLGKCLAGTNLCNIEPLLRLIADYADELNSYDLLKSDVGVSGLKLKGNYLFSFFYEGTPMKIWNIAKLDKNLKNLKDCCTLLTTIDKVGYDSVSGLAIYDPYLITHESWGVIKFWNIADIEEKIKKKKDFCLGPFYNRDKSGIPTFISAAIIHGPYFISGFSDGSIKFWNMIKLEENINNNKNCYIEVFDNTINGHVSIITQLILYDSYLISGSADKSIKIWNITNLEDRINNKKNSCLATFHYYGNSRRNAVSSLLTCGHYLFSCSYGGSIKIWNMSNIEENINNKKNRCLAIFNRTNSSNISEVKALLVYNTYIISGLYDGSIKFWNMSIAEKNLQNCCIATFDKTNNGHSDWVTSLEVYGNYLISGSYDKTIKIWDLSQLNESQKKTKEWCLLTIDNTINGKTYEVAGLLIYGNYLVSKSFDEGIMKFWNLDNLEKNIKNKQVCSLYTLIDENIIPHYARLSELIIYGIYLISSYEDGAIKIWSTRYNQLLSKSLDIE